MIEPERNNKDARSDVPLAFLYKMRPCQAAIRYSQAQLTDYQGSWFSKTSSKAAARHCLQEPHEQRLHFRCPNPPQHRARQATVCA